MATTTEEWIEVQSPYNGEVVGRAPKSGADDAAAGQSTRPHAPSSPRCRPTSARRSSTGSRACCASGTRTWPARSAPRRASRSRPRASRRRGRSSTYTFAAVEARKLAGDVVPMDASEAGEGQDRVHSCAGPIGVIGADLALQLPLQSRRAQARALRSPPGCPGRPQAGERNAALGAPARELEQAGGPSRRLAQRPRRPVRRDRRRAS
jgi:hypothetical protein